MNEADQCVMGLLAQLRPLAEFLYFLAGIVLPIGLFIAYLTYKSTRTHARQRNTIDKVATYREVGVASRIANVDRMIGAGRFASPFSVSSLTQQERSDVVYVLNEWNEIALGVQLRVYDDDILFMLYGAMARRMWTHLRPFVLERRMNSESKRAWLHFDWLFLRWMIRLTSVHGDEKFRELEALAPEMQRLSERLSRILR